MSSGTGKDPGGDAALGGAAALLTAYGLLVVLVDLVADKELVPHQEWVTFALLVALIVIGGVVGTLYAAQSRRR